MPLPSVTIYLPPEIIAKIDKLRGQKHRSDFLRPIILAGLNQPSAEDAKLKEFIRDEVQKQLTQGVTPRDATREHHATPRRKATERGEISHSSTAPHDVTSQKPEDAALLSSALHHLLPVLAQDRHPTPGQIGEAIGTTPEKVGLLLKKAGLTTVGSKPRYYPKELLPQVEALLQKI